MAEGGFGDLLSRASQLSKAIGPESRNPLVPSLEQGGWGDATFPATSQPATSFTPRFEGGDGEVSERGSAGTGQALEEGDLESYLTREREEMLMSIIDETLKAGLEDADRSFWESKTKEWKDWKKGFISRATGVATPSHTGSPSQAKTEKYRAPEKPGGSRMSGVELQLSRQLGVVVDKLMEGSMGRMNLIQTLGQPFRENSALDSYGNVWEAVESVLSTPLPQGRDLMDQRSSSGFSIALVNNSLQCLQKQFMEHMSMIVFDNINRAKLGGVPGTLQKVCAYLNVRFPGNASSCEDGVIEGKYPVWAVIYYCLRAGDNKAAVEAADKAGHPFADYASLLREFAPKNELSSDSEKRVRLMFSRSGRSGHDPFKRAVFCTLALCDSTMEHNEIADKFEDWLWLKLTQVRQGERRRSRLQDSASSSPSKNLSSGYLTLKQFQLQISDEYGERHFGSAESPLIFWTVLWLSGQFEAAIEYLSRQSSVLKSCGAHIAVACHIAELLLTPRDPRAPLISSEKTDPQGMVRLNFPRLIINYCTPFEVTDTRELLNYYYFLRKFKNSSGENLFILSISHLVMKTKEYEMLLGSRGRDGERRPGLLDRFRNVDMGELIEFIANELEVKGKIEEAVRFYDLGSNHSKALSLLSRLLSEVAPQASAPESRRERISELALGIASRYRGRGHRADEGTAATFFLLMDIVTFFDLAHSQMHQEALEVAEKLALVPPAVEEVDVFVKNFHMVPDEVRRLLADILVTYMSVLNQLYLSATATGKFSRDPLSISQKMNEKAKALIMFAGLVPYRLPAETHGQLVKLGSCFN